MALLPSKKLQERRDHEEAVQRQLSDINPIDHDGLRVFHPTFEPLVANSRDKTSLHAPVSRRFTIKRASVGRCSGHNHGRNVYYNDA